jgi:hypothetical protein
MNQIFQEGVYFSLAEMSICWGLPQAPMRNAGVRGFSLMSTNVESAEDLE